MSKRIDFTPPRFLFCELPIKNGTFNDNRVWVYCPPALSLIEIINVDDFSDFQFKGVQERYEYENPEGIVENYFCVFTQNNCEITDNAPGAILKEAWNFYKKYLEWEDNQIDL